MQARGNMENALIFAGENAYKVDKIISVSELMSTLEKKLYYHKLY